MISRPFGVWTASFVSFQDRSRVSGSWHTCMAGQDGSKASLSCASQTKNSSTSFHNTPHSMFSTTASAAARASRSDGRSSVRSTASQPPPTRRFRSPPLTVGSSPTKMDLSSFTAAARSRRAAWWPPKPRGFRPSIVYAASQRGRWRSQRARPSGKRDETSASRAEASQGRQRKAQAGFCLENMTSFEYHGFNHHLLRLL